MCHSLGALGVIARIFAGAFRFALMEHRGPRDLSPRSGISFLGFLFWDFFAALPKKFFG
jgi:hypothetical protein